MKLFQKHFLLFTSILVLCASCSKSPYAFLQNREPDKECLRTLKPKYSSALYKTSVDVTGKYLSGLLIIKKMEDGSTRIVFSNEMGLTFFDFEFFENEFRVLHCMKKLNRTVVLRALRKDLGMLIQSGYEYQKVKSYRSDSAFYYAYLDGNETTYFITDTNCTKLQRIEHASKRKKKVFMNFTGAGTGLPDSIYIAHQGFEFNIALKKLER